MMNKLDEKHTIHFIMCLHYLA